MDYFQIKASNEVLSLSKYEMGNRPAKHALKAGSSDRADSMPGKNAEEALETKQKGIKQERSSRNLDPCYC